MDEFEKMVKEKAEALQELQETFKIHHPDRHLLHLVSMAVNIEATHQGLHKVIRHIGRGVPEEVADVLAPLNQMMCHLLTTINDRADEFIAERCKELGYTPEQKDGLGKMFEQMVERAGLVIGNKE